MRRRRRINEATLRALSDAGARLYEVFRAMRQRGVDGDWRSKESELLAKVLEEGAAKGGRGTNG